MTYPGGNPPEGAWVIGDEPYGADVTEESMKAMYRGQVSAGFGQADQGLFGNILGGFGTIGNLLGNLLIAITGGGVFGGALGGIANFLSGKWLQLGNAETAANQAKSDAQGAITAAQQANNKVTALLQGGVRTVYTSNTTWTKPTGLVKLGVLLYGGGRRGANAGFSAPGGAGGAVVYAEFTADALPDTVALTIGAGSPNPSTASVTSFGTLIDSGQSGGGQLQNSTLLALASSIFPGAGGASGAANQNANIPGDPGGSTALAAGGTAGGGAGGNAPVTGQFLAGGGGGGGGVSRNQIFGAMTNGGAGGFPGGGGGGAGRNSNETYTVGGFGAPGLIALIEFKAAA